LNTKTQNKKEHNTKSIRGRGWHFFGLVFFLKKII